MTPDDVATLLLNGRATEPRWLGLGYCAHCQAAAWMNDWGYCASCWNEFTWSRENRAMCNFVHRGILTPRVYDRTSEAHDLIDLPAHDGP